MEKLKEDVVKKLRSCLASAPGMIDLRQLHREYKMLMGEDIPYKRMGFNRLEDMILSLPTINTTRNKMGELLVSAEPTKNMAHIMEMVSKQKTKKRRLPVHPRPSRYNHNVVVQKNMWRPKNVRLAESQKTYQSARRAAEVSHNQFVNHPLSPLNSVQTRRNVAPTNENTKSKQLTFEDKFENIENEPKSPESVEPTPVEVSENEKCPALAHAKLRLNKRMSALALKNTDAQQNNQTHTEPTMNNTNNNIQKKKSFALTGDDLEDLKRFAEVHGLSEPDIKVVTRVSKKPRLDLFDCKISVDGCTYTSYPESSGSNKELVMKVVAKKALDDLIQKYGRRRSLLLSNEMDILDRVPPMVQKHSNGLWNTQLEADYADKYNEQLPTNWIQVLDASPHISIIHSMGDRYIVQYCEVGDILQKGLKVTKPLTSNLSIPSNTITFREDNTLVAQVTCAVSAAELWCRQLDTIEAEMFDSMNKKLEEYYSGCNDSYIAVDIKVGGYYVAKFEDNWGRVRVLNIYNSVVNCFFVDYGDECEINIGHIYELVREFAIEQAQAFVCRLAGLEELYDVSTNCDCLQQLMSRTVLLESAVDDCTKIDPEDPAFIVYACDPDEGTQINQMLITQICTEAGLPKLFKGEITQVYTSHVENNGDLYIQLHFFGFDKLKKLLEDLENMLTEKPPSVQLSTITPENSKNRRYLIKDGKDNRWRRVRIIDWDPKKVYAQIYYVDIGRTDIITVKNETIYALDEIHEVISQFPDQAIKVRMNLDRPLSNFKSRISTLMQDGQKLLVKVIDYDVENVPIVEFFKRSESDNLLFSITSAILLESELRIQNHVNREPISSGTVKNSKLHKLISLSKTVPSSGVLKSPPLPQKGSYFDVKIPFAVNPWNFCVQPYSMHDKLTKLMTALQERFKDFSYSPLALEDVKPGHIYASRHVDGTWYRTSVIKVINVDSISAFYCDFGYYANLKLHQLVPLDPEFAELPYQAIKAKLAGIKPIMQKWTMDDCKFFQELVLKKLFVSICVSIETDELYISDYVLNLKLVDTSSAEDIYIDRILVEKKIALFDEVPK